MPIKLLAFDGDDTLWDNETHFHLTQTDFRDLLGRHAPDVDVDSRLFATEMANLKLYGYGIKSFTLSMLETALSITGGRIPAGDLEVILGWGKRMLRQPTELLPDVTETLQQLAPRRMTLPCHAVRPLRLPFHTRKPTTTATGIPTWGYSRRSQRTSTSHVPSPSPSPPPPPPPPPPP